MLNLLDLIDSALEKAKRPLTDDQKMVLAGVLAVSVEPVKAVVVHVGSNGTATHLPAREYLTRATVLQAVVAARASVASTAGLQLDAKALAKCRNLPWDLITPNHREQLRRDVTTVLEAMQALEP